MDCLPNLSANVHGIPDLIYLNSSNLCRHSIRFIIDLHCVFNFCNLFDSSNLLDLSDSSNVPLCHLLDTIAHVQPASFDSPNSCN